MIDRSMFFNDWHDIVRVLVVGTLGYVGLIVMLRVSRKRTLAQMNVFDFVYVVVMGELLATTILDDHVPLAMGLSALALLIALQALISWLTTKSTGVEHVINGPPTLLFHRGRFVKDALQAQRVTESEVLAAVREEGVADLDDVEAVVLETDGEFSVLHFGAPRRQPTLRDVPGAAHEADRGEDRPARAGGRAAHASSHTETAAR